MSIYSPTNLISRIRAIIKKNGNQEITGLVDQGILIDIVDSLRSYMADGYDDDWILPALLTKVNVADVIDVLTSSDATKPLSAKQGKALKTLIDGITALGAFGGDFNAAPGLLPTHGKLITDPIVAGMFWRISTGGTITDLEPDEVLAAGDVIYAKIDDAAVAADFFSAEGNQDYAEMLSRLIDAETIIGDLQTDKANVSDIVDNLTSTDATKILSAKQGKELKDLIDAFPEAIEYTPEDVANKATTLASPNDTTYPSSAAVSNALAQLLLDIRDGVPTIGNTLKKLYNLIINPITVGNLPDYSPGTPLYNWYAVNTGKLAPTGWHVPTDTEFNTLITFLGGSTVAGGHLKEAGLTHWDTPNTGADNSSGFTGLGNGERGVFGSFSTSILNTYAIWSSVDAGGGTSYYISLSYVSSSANQSAYQKVRGLSIRCMRTTAPEVSTITDYDGNVYDVIQIGTQWWLKQDLKTTHYNDGEAIPNVTDNTEWSALTTGALCYYNNTQLSFKLVIEDENHEVKKIDKNLVFPEPLKTTVNGSTSGTMVWTMPEQGSGKKEVIIQFNAFTDAGGTIITFPVAFGQAPAMVTTVINPTDISPTSITFPEVADVNGFVILKGF